jgi:hypothetical protein
VDLDSDVMFKIPSPPPKSQRKGCGNDGFCQRKSTENSAAVSGQWNGSRRLQVPTGYNVRDLWQARSRGQNCIMAQKQFAGTVLVNGSERRLQIDGNPLGRTVVQVDGVTAYDKKPFVHRETIDFDIVPGKKASLRWQQVSLKMECAITVDGHTSKLAAVARNGSAAKPVRPEQRQRFEAQALGAGFLALAAGALALNYFELQKGSYHPQYLVVTPLFLVGGIAGLTHPRFDPSTPGKKRAYVVFCGLLLIAGWFFKNWFESTFGPQ